MHQTLWREFCRGFSNPAGPQGRVTVTTDGYETTIHVPFIIHHKGAPALESRTEGRLVSPTAAAEKKNVPLIEFGF